jgi:HSP20 family molecular chaperone IbpA
MEIPVRIINTEQVSLNNKTLYVPQQTFERNIPQTLTDLAKSENWTKIIPTEDMIGQQLMGLKGEHLKVKIDTVLRCIIVKVPRQHMSKYQLMTPYRKVLQVPESADINQVKVILYNEKKVVVVKAPKTTSNRYNQQNINLDQCDQFRTVKMQQNFQLLNEQSECETEVVEHEPRIYKILKNLSKALPQNIFVPRCVLNRQTGLYNIHLDTKLTGFQPEHVQVALNDLENVLVIKAEKSNEELFTNTEHAQFGFNPKFLRHEIQLPKLVLGKKISWIKLNDNTMRIRLPIDQLKQMI